MSVKEITKMGIVAAIYVVLTIVVSPISFGIIQFRVSEILKPMALKGKYYPIALSIGLFIANLFSPYSGVMELLFMPIMCLIGGYIAYALRKWPLVANTVYAVIISLAVAFVLKTVVGLPYWVTAGTVAISEVILINAGWKVIEIIFRGHRQEQN